jgi:hypothetical protein
MHRLVAITVMAAGLLTAIAGKTAAQNPTPVRDSVSVSNMDRTTGKVGELPAASVQKLQEFSLTLDLSRDADRVKLIQKWQELAGAKASRHTVTIWAAQKQYVWPPPPKTQPAVTWQSDWGMFIDELSPYLKRGAPIAEVKEKFEGKPVIWEGEVREISLKADAASIKLKMPAKTVTLHNGGKISIDYLHLAPLKENAKKWEAVKAGDTIRFRSTLKGDSLFPVVVVLTGVGENAGKDRVIISLHDGELVEVSKKAKAESQASPSQLLGKLTTTVLNLNAQGPVPVVITPEHQGQLMAWERTIIEGKAAGAFVFNNSGYNGVRLDMIEKYIGKPDRTTKETVKEIIQVADGSAKPLPLTTHWYGPTGLSVLADSSLIAVFYHPDKARTEK